MPRLRSLLSLSWADRALLVEAVWLTACARLAILTLPFRWIGGWLGEHQEATSDEADLDHLPLLCRVGWAVAAADRHTPWQAKCLVQAMAARSMLARRGVEGTIYFGLLKTAEGDLKAHAWIRCGRRIVTGREGYEPFTTVSTFAFGPRTNRPRHDSKGGKGEQRPAPRSIAAKRKTPDKRTLPVGMTDAPSRG